MSEDARATIERLQRQLGRVARHQDALLRLASPAEATLEARVRALVQVTAQTLDVARVSVWRLAEDGTRLRCAALFRADTGAFEHGLVLAQDDYPRYFAALRTGAVVVADDAHADPRTSEFSTGYLRPLGIGAMMDVPVWVQGSLAGVICHEHVGGPRTWATDEQLFATSICQLLSLAIESDDRRRAEEALRESEARFRAIAHVSPEPLIVSALPGGECLWANEAASAVSGMPSHEIVGKQACDFYVRPEDRDAVMARLAAEGHVEGEELELRRADGTTFWGVIAMRTLTFAGRPAAIVNITDVSEQRRLSERLRHAAMHDALTGLPNRAMLFELLRRELARARRDPAETFAVLYLDLDGFKGVNDRLGHDVGDQLLVSAAERLRAAVRPMDTPARMGGDEFAVLLPAVGGDAEARQVADRIEAELARPHELGPYACATPASIGLVTWSVELAGPDAVLKAADTAMYHRKRARRTGR